MRLIIASSILFASFAVSANPAGQFIGKYSVDPSMGQNECRLGVDAERAYITLGNTIRGQKVLTIQSFGVESRMTDIPVESGIVQTSGTRREDLVVDRIKVSFPTPNSMRVSVKTEAPARNISYEEVTTLTMNGKVLTVKSRMSNDPIAASDCVLRKK